MSARIDADQTADGWNVTVSGAETVTVQTSGTQVRVTVAPDEPEPTPLAVALDKGSHAPAR